MEKYKERIKKDIEAYRNLFPYEGKASQEIADEVLMDVMCKLVEEVEDSNWKNCDDEYPPNNCEILAKAPNGIIHLTSWRPAYEIFCCQEKREDTYNWKWKYIEGNSNLYTKSQVEELLQKQRELCSEYLIEEDSIGENIDNILYAILEF